MSDPTTTDTPALPLVSPRMRARLGLTAIPDDELEQVLLDMHNDATRWREVRRLCWQVDAQHRGGDPDDGVADDDLLPLVLRVLRAAPEQQRAAAALAVRNRELAHLRAMADEHLHSHQIPVALVLAAASDDQLAGTLAERGRYVRREVVTVTRERDGTMLHPERTLEDLQLLVDSCREALEAQRVLEQESPPSDDDLAVALAELDRMEAP